MARNVHIEIDPGLRRELGPVAAVRRNRILRQVLESWADHSTAVQRVYAPIGNTGYLHRHIGQSNVIYEPGAPGGGGGFAVYSGVKRGTSDHPFYVHFGTKNPVGQTPAAMLVGGVGGQGRIYPKAGRSASIYQNEDGDFKQRRQVEYLPGLDPFRVRKRANTFLAGQQQPALRFVKQGEGVRYRAWVSGQAPKPFVYFAFLQTSVYAKGQLHSLAKGLMTDRSR